jgi:hypothetical protein
MIANIANHMPQSDVASAEALTDEPSSMAVAAMPLTLRPHPMGRTRSPKALRLASPPGSDRYCAVTHVERQNGTTQHAETCNDQLQVRAS